MPIPSAVKKTFHTIRFSRFLINGFFNFIIFTSRKRRRAAPARFYHLHALFVKHILPQFQLRINRDCVKIKTGGINFENGAVRLNFNADFLKRRADFMKKTAFIIAAAGSASRMGRDKIFLSLAGRPAVSGPLLAAQYSESITEIIISAKQTDVLAFWNLAKTLGVTKLKAVVTGGETRQQSVTAALDQTDAEIELIAVHDGARPLVTTELIDSVCADAEKYGAAVPALAVTDSLKEASDGFVVRTADRDRFFSVQTPQVFDAGLYRGAMSVAASAGKDFRDDCQLFEFMGHSVYLSAGDPRNIKLTGPIDIAVAKILAEGEFS